MATLTGQPFTGVTTQTTVQQAADLIDWPAFRARQAAARQQGRYLGLGIACYLGRGLTAWRAAVA